MISLSVASAAAISAASDWQRVARAFSVTRVTYSGSAVCPEGLVRCRAVISADVASDRYFARSLSGAETRRPLIWLIAAVRAFNAEARPARRIRKHSTGPSLAFGTDVVRPSSTDFAAS